MSPNQVSEPRTVRERFRQAGEWGARAGAHVTSTRAGRGRRTPGRCAVGRGLSSSLGPSERPGGGGLAPQPRHYLRPRPAAGEVRSAGPGRGGEGRDRGPSASLLPFGGHRCHFWLRSRRPSGAGVPGIPTWARPVRLSSGHFGAESCKTKTAISLRDAGTLTWVGRGASEQGRLGPRAGRRAAASGETPGGDAR